MNWHLIIVFTWNIKKWNIWIPANCVYLHYKYCWWFKLYIVTYLHSIVILLTHGFLVRRVPHVPHVTHTLKMNILDTYVNLYNIVISCYTFFRTSDTNFNNYIWNLKKDWLDKAYKMCSLYWVNKMKLRKFVFFK